MADAAPSYTSLNSDESQGGAGAVVVVPVAPFATWCDAVKVAFGSASAATTSCTAAARSQRAAMPSFKIEKRKRQMKKIEWYEITK